MRINDIITLKNFDSVIDLSWAESKGQQERLLSNYILTENLSETFTSILESINFVRSSTRRVEKNSDLDIGVKRAHIISGQYGTGKSYFLLMLSIILEMKDSEMIEKLLNKFKSFPELYYQVKYIKENKKYLVVRINGEAESEKEFKDVVQSQVINAIKEKFPTEQLSTIYSQYLNIIDNNLLINQAERTKMIAEDLDEDLNDIRLGLINYRKEFIPIAKELVEKVLGVKPQIEYGNLESFFKEVNDILKRNGYDEVIIIFDEFSAYLSSSIEFRRNAIDLGKIQELAQLTTINKPDSKVSFIASTHRDLVSMIGNNGINTKDELEKIFGRFSSHILAFDQGEELLKNTISLDKVMFQPYVNKYDDYIKTLNREYNLNFEDFYPLHPATVKYLEPVSKIYAQKVRTTFSFLKEVVIEKFSGKEIEENGKLNLITLSDLFDYFEDAIEEKNSKIAEVYNQANREIINKIDAHDISLIQFLKAITVAYSSNNSKSLAEVELSAEELGLIYQIDDIDEIKTKMLKLVTNKYINITKNNEKYRLFVNQSGIDIDELINQEKSKINPYKQLIRMLDASKHRIAIKNEYEIKNNYGLYPIDRYIRGSMYSVADIRRMSISELLPHEENVDAKINFVIPGFNEKFERDSLINYLRDTLENEEDNVCIAVPKEIFFEEEVLIEYGAILLVENKEEIQKHEEMRKLLIGRKRKLEDKIRNKYIRKFANLKNFDFIFSKGKIKNDIRQDITLFKELLYNYYYKFPQGIIVENFNTNALNAVMKQFVTSETEIVNNTSANDSKQIKTMLKPLDLVTIDERVDKYLAKLKFPETNLSSKHIMDIIEDTDIELEEKIIKLKRAPYGLDENMIKLYLYITNKLGRIIVIKDKNTPVFLSQDTLKVIFVKPSSYRLEKNKIEEIDLRVKLVWQVFAENKFTGASKVKKFNPKGENEFNVLSTLSAEMTTSYNTLKDVEERLSKKEVKTGNLKVLVNKLSKIVSEIRPKEKYEGMIRLVDMFRRSSFDDNLESLKDLLSQAKRLKSKDVSTFEAIYSDIKTLEYSIRDLNKFDFLRENLKSVQEKYNEYTKDFYNIELLEELAENIANLKRDYNSEYIRLHNTYHEKYMEEVNQLKKNKKQILEALKSLRKFKFTNIADIGDILEKIKIAELCTVEKIENKIVECKNCSYINLKSLELPMEELEEEFKIYDLKIQGVFAKYKENLFNLRSEDEFRFDSNFRKLLQDLNAIENGEEIDINSFEINVDNLEEKVNQYQREAKDIFDSKTISLQEIEKKFHLAIQGSGEVAVSFEDLEKTFKDILESYKIKNFKNIKLS